MLKPIENWDKIEGIEFGDYEALELGGHEVVIKKAYQYTSKQSGNTSLKIEVDIAGDDKQAGYFQKQFDNNPNADKTWPNGACRYVSLKEEENCVALLKGFITAIENSNQGFTWTWNEEDLKGKKLCGVFGLEEYEKQDGNTGFATKLLQFRSLDKLSDVKIPKVKLLDGGYIDYEEYKALKTSKNDDIKVIKGDKVDEFINDNMLD